MAYCGPRALPLSTFLGSKTPGVWEDTDREAALDWQSSESRRCSGCGTHPDDWGDGPKWTASLIWCPGCAEVERAGRDPEAKHPGVRIHMSR